MFDHVWFCDMYWANWRNSWDGARTSV